MAGEPGVTVGGESAFKWNKEQTTLLIRLRGENDHLFTGVKNSATVAWRTILEKMGLQGTVTPLQARKKWDNLKTKYKECKYPGSGEGVSGKPTAATWPWFALMDEVIGQRPSIRPPVLLSTLPEDTPGPSSAVGDQNVAESDTDEGESQPTTTARKRKRDRDEELLNLIREDMQQQREAEERRAQESRERMDRLFSILERLIPK
ncbi:RalBP1-associated Eps domain-containing protein [Sarotherodon galilaeus]